MGESVLQTTARRDPHEMSWLEQKKSDGRRPAIALE
jgi:hypothetical protein